MSSPSLNGAAGRATGAGRTLLYIDPDSATRLLVHKALAGEGFTVLEARTALEGQRSAEARPDLVLVDVDVVRAAELVVGLRRSPGFEQVQLLALTAHGWPEHLEKLLAWGFDRVLLEPLDIDTLGSELESCLPPAVEIERFLEPPAPPQPPSTALLEAHRNGGSGAIASDTVEIAAVVERSSATPEAGTGLDEVSVIDAARTTSSIAAAEPEVSATNGNERVMDAAAGPSPASATSDGEGRGSVAEPSRHVEEPTIALEPIEVSPLWLLALAPLTSQLVRSTGSGAGFLALFDETERELVVVAAVSSRHVDSGPAIHPPRAVGTRVPASSVPWMGPALERREAVVVATDALAPSLLLPAGSQHALIVPVSSRERVYGVAVLGKHRASRPATFSADRLARSLAQGAQIAAVVEMLKDHDRVSGRRRRELADMRGEAVRAILLEMMGRAKQFRRNAPGRDRTLPDTGNPAADDGVIALGVAVAERLGLSPRQREVLRQALEVHDVGRTWTEHVLLARAMVAGAERERMLARHAEYGAEILKALDWPSAVVEVVRVQQAHWNGKGHPAGLAGQDIPVEARVMAVVVAFIALTADRGSPDARAVGDALAQLRREAGHRYDPAVVEALVALHAPVATEEHDGLPA
jgi:response regulator RpfG family c-di-GMP phosphodiesterase